MKRACLFACLYVFASFSAAQTHVWTGNTDTDWHTAGNWDAGVPGAGASVLITNANNAVELSSDSAALSSLIISNNTLTFKNWSTTLNADNVTIRSDGKLTVPGSFQDTEMSNRVKIACVNLTVQKGGQIDVDGGGFYPWDGPGAGGKHSSKEGGGGYGGRGGYGTRNSNYGSIADAGEPYGSAAMPVHPGSGAGTYNSAGHRALGGAGGGAVYINASGTVQVNGTITADGDPSLGYLSGAGSGGGIYIACDTFEGSTNGLIRARGGDAFNGTDAAGGGGGGRIAVDYNSVGVQHGVRFDASGARVDWAYGDMDARYYIAPRMGTLWLPDAGLLDTLLSENQFTECRIMGLGSWSPASLVVSNCSVTFGEDGFVLDVAGNVTIGADGELGIGSEYPGTNFELRCAGNVTVTNGGELWVYAGETNDAAFGYGALVRVTNQLAVGPSSWVHPVCEWEQTNGASALFHVGSLHVAAGGGFNACSKGYTPCNGPGVGAGFYNNAYLDGSGHGGLGGVSPSGASNSRLNEGGKIYGSVSMPLSAGSGGSHYTTHTPEGGTGGGVIRLDVDGTATVSGTLKADGGPSLGDYGSAASGGSVYLKCGTFGGAASGLIAARGGTTDTQADRTGAGGGGRIAVDYGSLSATHATRFNAAPGAREPVTIHYNEIDYHRFRAQEGTLWVSDTGLFTEVLNGQFDEVRIFGPTSWSPTSLVVSNSKCIFAEPDFVLDVSGNVRIDTNSWFGIGDKHGATNGALLVQGSLVVTNGGGLHVYAGATDVVNRAYGVRVKVTNDIAIGPDSWIYPYSHRTDGGSPKFECSNLFIAKDGGFYGYARGYGSYEGPGAPYRTSAGGGGSYGGRGGAGKYNDNISFSYGPVGTPYTPRIPGSGGGVYNGYGRLGGPGGGLVWIEAANAVTVDGTIQVNGFNNDVQWLTGGGAGGGVYITCDTFGGSADGLVQAKGGNGYTYGTDLANNGGAGSGGRISIDYNSLSGSPGIRFSAPPGDVSWAYPLTSNLWQVLPRAGTVALPDAELLGTDVNDSRIVGAASLWFHNISSLALDHLTISNCVVGFGQDDFQLVVSNDLVVSSGGEFMLGEYGRGSNWTLSVHGDLILTNGGDFSVFGGLTNAMGEEDISAVVEVTNDVVVRADSWIYPSAHDVYGGAPVLRMRNLLVDNGGGIDADSKGYRGRTGPGQGQSLDRRQGGGGYGGRGGDGHNPSYSPDAQGGSPYGLTNGPALPGSGGGEWGSYLPQLGSCGGGPVRIEARGDVTVDGTITANAGLPVGRQVWLAGAAGGGIYIVCSNFSGAATGVMQAEGNAPEAGANNAGGGGGGRVSVWNNVEYWARTNHWTVDNVTNLVVSETFANYFGTVSVTNGPGSYAGGTPAEPGTAFYLRQKWGNAWEFQVLAEPEFHDSPSPNGYGSHLDVQGGSWITNNVESPTDEAAGQRWVTTGWDVEDYDNNPVNSGSTTQAWFQLTTNMYLTWSWTNEWLLTVGSEANGTVNSNLYNGWQTNDVVINVITATPSGGYIFNGWIGDYPLGHQTDNPLSVTMDQARSITATFAVAVIETNLWTGTGTWDNVSNWSQGHVPKNIDHVIVESGQLTIDAPKYFASLVVSNDATLAFSNWLTTAYITEDVVVRSNGLITAWGPVTNGMASNRVALVCSNLLVEKYGAIDVTGKGFDTGFGPGAGGLTTAYYQSGGGYGGHGGYGYRNTDVKKGLPYGSVAAPLQLGSGSGSYDNTVRRTASGKGGGAIRIEAEHAVIVNGNIIADGSASVGDNLTAGGSGGSIYITCDTFGGTDGVLRVRGGDSPNAVIGGGGGGGGRIAVDYNTLAAQRDLHFCAGPAAVDWGRANVDERWPSAARMGTLWLPETNLLASPITDNLFSDTCVYIDGVTVLSLDSLTISNASLTFPENEFELRVAGNVLIGELGSLGVGGYYERGSNFLMAVGGSVTLTNGGTLHLYAGETNGVAGDEGVLLDVTNDVAIGPLSWLVSYCQETNGASPRMVMQNLRVASGGGIQASARGYRSKFGPGLGYTGGQTGGSGHGGRGGASEDAYFGGEPYGSLDNPLTPGSGGQTHPSHTMNGGAGGGVIRVEARGAIDLDGVLAANGASYQGSSHGSGGSGGSINLQCDTFGGSGGLVRVDGGSQINTNSAGEGAGGRIAVDYNSLGGTPVVAFSARGGTNGWTDAEHAVEDRWMLEPQAGTLSLPDAGLLPKVLNQDAFAGETRVYFRDVSSWNPASLVVSNCAVNFADPELQLTVSGDVRIDTGGKFGLGDDPDGSNYVLHCANLVVTNGGTAYIYAGKTNDSSQGYGTLVTVDQQLAVGLASWIYPVAHRFNGATVLFEAGNVFVADSGGFNANAKGYFSRLGPGASETVSKVTGGAGFGGRGGDGDTYNQYTSGPGGPVYGSTNAPVQPGSGGGTYPGLNYWARGGSGGGSVRIDARDRLTLKGTITAQGGMSHYGILSGAGSGGGITLFCGDFAGAASGKLSVRGADAFDRYLGPGGGGRIAVWEGFKDSERAVILAGGTVPRMVVSNDLTSVFAGSVVSTNGAGYRDPSNPPEVGTVRLLLKLPPAGSLILVR